MQKCLGIVLRIIAGFSVNVAAMLSRMLPQIICGLFWGSVNAIVDGVDGSGGYPWSFFGDLLSMLSEDGSTDNIHNL